MDHLTSLNFTIVLQKIIKMENQLIYGSPDIT